MKKTASQLKSMKPSSDTDLNKFQLSHNAGRKLFLDSLNQSSLDQDKPKEQRQLV